MNKEDLLKIIKELSFDTKRIIYKNGNTELYILRPSELSNRFKSYGLKKNFQIWLKEKDREFRPNHLRVMIDLNLRIRSKPELKKKLLLAFDNIFYGEDPEEELKELSKEKFEHFLNPLIAIGYCAQIFLIEQEYNYNKESKFDPLTLFLQGWIRQFIDSLTEIDNLCMSVCNRQPPKAKYVNLENKKNKKHVNNLRSLWYLEEK